MVTSNRWLVHQLPPEGAEIVFKDLSACTSWNARSIVPPPASTTKYCNARAIRVWLATHRARLHASLHFNRRLVLDVQRSALRFQRHDNTAPPRFQASFAGRLHLGRANRIKRAKMTSKRADHDCFGRIVPDGGHRDDPGDCELARLVVRLAIEDLCQLAEEVLERVRERVHDAERAATVHRQHRRATCLQRQKHALQQQSGQR